MLDIIVSYREFFPGVDALQRTLSQNEVPESLSLFLQTPSLRGFDKFVRDVRNIRIP